MPFVLFIGEPIEPAAPDAPYLSGNENKPACDGKVAFEGEFAIVIGKTATAVSEVEGLDHVFGYTCANDVTLADALHRDPSFTQWDRAKGFDTFCAMDPAVAPRPRCVDRCRRTCWHRRERRRACLPMRISGFWSLLSFPDMP